MNSKILDSINKTVLIELQEIERLLNRIDESFEIAVNILKNCEGKIVVCGIGKSAIIGNKFVATLNSTGTLAQFLHAADAIHGDLGLLQKEDVVVCISNSGNSPEIKNLVSILKQKSSSLIAITGNNASLLAELADCVLNSKVQKEACPNNLAPTSSTTVQLVITDALAVALMEEKNFQSDDFAQIHPGGSLGKKLTMKVSDLVNTQYKPLVHENDNIKEVILALSASPHGITLVNDENENIAGVITDGDLRRSLLNNENYTDIKASDILTKNPKTIQKDRLLTEALDVLHKFNIGQIIVLDGEEYYGILELHHIIEEGII